MIRKLNELNRVLLAVESVAGGSGEADYYNVLTQCNSVVVEGLLPDHELSIKFCESMELIIRKENVIMITSTGKDFLELNVGGEYELSPDQKKYLLRMCYLHGSLRLKSLKLMKKFLPNYEQKTFRLSLPESILDSDEVWLIEHFVQLQLIIRNNLLLDVSTEYSDTVASFIAEGYGWTESSLIEYLQERREVGSMAEDIALKFERERLSKQGCAIESICVRQISKLKVNAGYDIESFDGSSYGLQYDRFIEVKGAKDSKLKFFLSENELKVAKQLGNKYWIYFQGGIDVKTGTAKNELLLFQNPYETVVGNPEFAKTPQGVIVEKNIAGKLIVH